MTIPQSRVSLDAFRASMPRSYCEKYSAQSILAHAAISSRRKNRPAKVGVFDSPYPTRAALCVVAEDRPGLLAIISAALLRAGVEVMDAEAYTRVSGKWREAVDIFWVEKPGVDSTLELTQSFIAELEQSLLSLLDQGHPPKEEQLAPGTRGDTRVRFVEATDGGVGILEVETDDRSGLLLALARALYLAQVQIVGCEVKTLGPRVFDRFSIVELDDSSITAERRLEIQVAVLSAIESRNLSAQSGVSA